MLSLSSPVTELKGVGEAKAKALKAKKKKHRRIATLVSILSSFVKNGLNIVYTNKHLGHLQHHFQGIDLDPTLQLLNI